MNNTELTNALQYIRTNGYSAVIERNTIIVEDPVYSSGIGAVAGNLILAGNKLVNIRTFKIAIKFINDRS